MLKMVLLVFFILFFSLLLSYQILYDDNNKSLYFIEGLEDATSTPSGTDPTSTPSGTNSAAAYQPYNDNDPLILSKTNAANIEYIKGRIDDLYTLKPMVMDMSLNLVQLNQEVATLYQQQQSYAATLNTGPPISSSSLQ